MRKNSLKRLHREVEAYTAFYAVIHPEPMLKKYPRVDGIHAHRKHQNAIAERTMP